VRKEYKRAVSLERGLPATTGNVRTLNAESLTRLCELQAASENSKTVSCLRLGVHARVCNLAARS
jgi:hypothetical protein